MRAEAAMVFAAGFGTRMGELTKDTPKPMLKVASKPLIDYALDHVFAAGINRVVVNTHYLPDPINEHLETRPGVTLLHEKNEILETGGGLRNALPLLGPGPVVTMNPDAIFLGRNPVIRLREADLEADALLLLVRRENALMHKGLGDFDLAPDGGVQRPSGDTAEYVYTGAQIIDPKRLDEIPEVSFSLNVLWNKMLSEGRVKGVIYPGRWVDVGTPEGLERASAEVLWP